MFLISFIGCYCQLYHLVLCGCYTSPTECDMIYDIYDVCFHRRQYVCSVDI